MTFLSDVKVRILLKESSPEMFPFPREIIYIMVAVGFYTGR